MSEQTRKKSDTDRVDDTMRMLRERAEDGVIHITNEGVEAFIRDALQRIWLARVTAGPPVRQER